MRKFGLTVIVLQIALFGVFGHLFVPAAHAQTGSPFLDGILNLLRGVSAVVSPPAKCSDNLSKIKGNPLLADEHRNIGSDDDCNTDSGKYVNVTYTIKGTKSCPFPFEPGCLQMDLIPQESGVAGAPGFTKSSKTPGGNSDTKDQIQGYADSRTRKAGIESRRQQIQQLKELGDKADYTSSSLFFLNESGVSERLQNFLCKDALGNVKSCEKAKREDVLRAAARGYMFSTGDPGNPSENLAAAFGLNPQDRFNFELSDDPVLGWLHAPCLVDKTCTLGDTYLDTAWSTDKLGVAGELPYYGIMYFCQKEQFVKL